MSFNNLKYDKDAYKEFLFESTGPGRYQEYSKATSLGKDACFQDNPEFRSSGGQLRISDPNSMVAMESDLFNLIRKATKDPRGQFPYVQPTYKQKPMLESCSRTKLSRKYPTLEGNQFNREKTTDQLVFQQVCLNPQKMNRIRSNNYIGMQTRLYFRDNFKARIPKQINQTAGLPQGGKFESPLTSFMNDVQDSFPAPIRQRGQKSLPKSTGKVEGFCTKSCSRKR